MAGFCRIEQPESPEHGSWSREQSGFTLIETIVAMLLVAMMIVGFAPLYSYIRSHELKNMTRVVAYNLAESQIEQIKSTSFDSMGTQGGNPSGSTPQTQTKPLYPTTNNNINCIINTQIQWEADPSRSQGSVDQTDYKEIAVEVKAFLGKTLNTDGSNLLQDVIVTSMASQEGAEDPPGNNIIVYAQRGWNTNQNASTNPIPATDLPVTVTSSGSSINMQTDPSTGKIIFGQLSPPATYSVSLSNSWNANGTSYAGMMEFPGDSINTDQPFTLTSTDTTYILNPYIHVETPCSLNLNFDYLQLSASTCSSNSVQSSINGIATLSSSFSIATYSVAGSSLAISGPLWPVGAGWSWYNQGSYSLAVNPTSGYYPYAIANSSNTSVGKQQDWSGNFDNPGENLPESLNLLPLPAVLVTDSSTGNPISGASVTVYPYTWTYSATNIAWGNATQGTSVANGNTGSNGYCSFSLSPTTYNSGLVTTYPYPSPNDGVTCTTYGIQVAKTGYTTQTISGAFWIFDIYNTGSSGLQMTWSNGMSQNSMLDYPVILATQ